MFLLFKALKHSQIIPTYFGPCEGAWIIQESVRFWSLLATSGIDFKPAQPSLTSFCQSVKW